MSIPERIYKIAKYKLNDFKDRLDQLDAETQKDWESERKYDRKQARSEAGRELEEAMSNPTPTTTARTPTGKPAPDIPSIPAQAPRPRTPEEIARGSRGGGYSSPSNYSSGTTANTSASQGTTQQGTTANSASNDPLTYHYRLMGVEPGADFSLVMTAYNKLAARCDPSRFPAGSQDEQQARELRSRLDESYKVLRDSLDPTARRFDLLEFDEPKPPV